MRILPWNLVFLAGLITFVGIRHHFIVLTRGIERKVRRSGALDKALLAGAAGGSLLLPALYVVTPWLSFADYRLPAFAPWCGTGLMVAGLWLFHRAHTDLGHNWSVTLELRHDHQIVSRGVYRLIRHPMYASLWLWGFAQGLLLENWLAGWAALVTFALLYFVRLPREERMMVECFGEEYVAYARRTGRLFPRLGKEET